MKFTTQISSILMALLFVFTINFKSLLTINYFLNIEEITELFCIKKEKPKLASNGKCHLTNQLVDADRNESENPFYGNQTHYNLKIISIVPDVLHGLKNQAKEIQRHYWYNQYHILENYYILEFS